MRNVQCVVQEFCELLGAIINWNKSTGIRMKNNGVSHWLPHLDFQWLQHGRSIRCREENRPQAQSVHKRVRTGPSRVRDRRCR